MLPKACTPFHHSKLRCLKLVVDSSFARVCVCALACS
jgi:hypothetical protein